MKKRKILLLLIVICVGMFIPNKVSAISITSSYNIEANYNFKDADGKGNLQFQLYDATGLLSFDSVYDSSTGKYSFLYSSTIEYESGVRNFIPDSLLLNSFNNTSEFVNYFNTKNISGSCSYEHDKLAIIHNDECNYYSYIPFTLEEKTGTGIKKIVFGAINYHFFYYYDGEIHYSFNILFINNDDNIVKYSEFEYGYCDSYEDNVFFMRNSMYDYNDELWDELNNRSIASSEISFDNSCVVRDNVESNSLDGPSIIRFNKISNDDKASDSKNIISNISNPKTFNNGILIIIFSIIIVIGSSVLIINKKKNKGDMQ